jgi:hypothetical protein
MRTTSPVTGSVNDVCVVTLLRVVVDVTVALCAIGGAAAGSTRAGAASLGGGGAETRRPVAESGGDTSPGLGLAARRRSVEDIELE